MKKILSLLLALTMVLSLAIVPARAEGTNEPGESQTDVYSISGVAITPTTTQGGNTISGAVEKGTSITFTIDTTKIQVQKNGEAISDGYTLSYSWDDGFSAQSEHPNVATITAQQSVTAGCKVSVMVNSTAVCETTAHSSEVAVYDLSDAIAQVYFNDRPYTASNNSATIYLAKDETLAGGEWSVEGKTGYAVSGTPTFTNNKLTGIKVSYGEGATPTDKDITITTGTFTAPSISITNPTNSNNKVKTNQQVEFTATVSDSGKSDNTKYSWTIQKTGAATTATPTSAVSRNTYSWTPSEEGTYKVTCTLYEGNVVTNTTSSELLVTVEKDNTQITKSFNATMAPNTKQILSFTFKDKDSSGNLVDATSGMSDVTWTVSPTTGVATGSPKKDSTDQKKAEFSIGASPASSYTVKASFTYQNKPYEVEFNISTRALTATLSYGVENGSYTDLYKTTLADIAQRTIRAQVSGKSSVTVSSTGVTLARTSATRGTLNTYSSSSYYRYNAPSTYIGKDELKLTATASDGNTYTITLTIPITPIPDNNLGSVTAEPVSTTTTTTSYRVYFPTTYSRYYVINKTGSAPSSWTNVSLGSSYYSSTNPYTLSASDFNSNGTCTLYVVAQNVSGSSYGNYYSGPITVTQTNYNIQYNGVAGETVQFKQADFNDFMEEVAKARGDVSTRNSYPYVTFDNVTFTMPTTQQGTLYYNGTAMSTRSGSSYFNSSTKVTNLDNITFVPYAKTNAKTITLNFTLNATKYTSASSKGTTVSYSGSVVVSIVREDIKYTVAQGDTVRFTDSDFLTYLRSQSGFSSNYTIDYVTFDQSAVSTVNGGVLYSYYNSGTNYGSAAKTTDKFYYTTTSYNQNALSDVAFRASNYAKSGDTVYIPFTIYARYGSTGTGTRQLTGTVAIQIGQTMNFTDVKSGDFFYEPVKWAVSRNITNGTSNTTFSPYKTCTRAEIVTFLWRAAGSPEPTITRNPFNDVNAVTHSSYYKAILWASQKGITSGTTATTFSPDATCTRAQIVTFLYRYAGKPSSNYSNPFKDVNATTEASYYNAILWAVGKNITTGTSSTTFSPYASCTRGEAVTFLYRYVNGVN